MTRDFLSAGLPKASYTCEEIFRRERDRIFGKQWFCLGHSKYVRFPGQYLSGIIADQAIFAIRGQDDRLRAFYNVCQHRAHELVREEFGDCPRIVCPYHSWSYDYCGRLLTARGCEKAIDGRSCEITLKEISVGELCGFVFASLDRDPTPLEIYAAEWAERIRGFGVNTASLVRAFQTVHDVRCNWKLLIENSMECGHCASAHPAFRDQVRLDEYTVNRLPWRYVTYAHSYMKDGTFASRFSDARNKDEAGLIKFKYLYLWPNTEARLIAGTANFLMRRQIPIRPDLTRVYNTLYLAPEDAKYAEAYQSQLHDSTFAEDIELVESAQRGMNSAGFARQLFMTPEDLKYFSEDDLLTFNRRVTEELELGDA